MLKISEELFLLSLDDARGRIHRSFAIPLRFTMGGALLADLFLAGRINLNSENKVILGDQTTCDDPLINGLIKVLKTSFFRPRKMPPLLEEINPRPKKLLNRLGMGLVEKGILNFEEKRYLWVIPYQVFPQFDATAKYWIKQHLRGVVLASDVADMQTIIVLRLLLAGGMLNLVFTKDEMKFARSRIQKMASDWSNDRQASDLVDEIEKSIKKLVTTTVSS